MIFTAVFYNSDSGEILRTMTATLDTLALNVGAGEGLMMGEVDGRAQRIDVSASPHVVVAKTVQPVTVANATFSSDGEDGVQISGIADDTVAITPKGTRIEMHPDFGGELELVVDLAGDYQVTLEHPLYLDTVVEFTAT